MKFSVLVSGHKFCNCSKEKYNTVTTSTFPVTISTFPVTTSTFPDTISTFPEISFLQTEKSLRIQSSDIFLLAQYGKIFAFAQVRKGLERVKIHVSENGTGIDI